MKVSEYRAGTPNWVDFASPDIKAAAEFYGALFGWHATDLGDEAGNYHMFDVDGSIVAAGGPKMAGDPSPPAWMTYISVDDATATAAAIEANGGTVMMQPMDVFDAGRMAVAADPSGGVFAIWQPGTTKGAQLVNEPNTWCWNELTAHDMDRLLPFYRSVFGWEINAMTDDEGNTTYREVQVGGREVAGCMEMDETWPEGIPTHWMTYFAVADCDATAAKAVELGATQHVGPTDIPPGRFAVLQDPTGPVFSIIAYAEHAPD